MATPVRDSPFHPSQQIQRSQPALILLTRNAVEIKKEDNTTHVHKAFVTKQPLFIMWAALALGFIGSLELFFDLLRLIPVELQKFLTKATS